MYRQMDGLKDTIQSFLAFQVEDFCALIICAVYKVCLFFVAVCLFGGQIDGDGT